MNLNLLKETFVSFIRARGMDRHFRRLGMDMFRSAPVTRKSRQPWPSN
jgi:Mg2+-importing ATPase